METAAAEGQTVVFVSHDMSAIESVCDRVLVLEGGRMVESSEPERPEDAVGRYRDIMDPAQTIQHGGVAEVPGDAQHFGTGEGRIVEIALRSLDGQPISRVAYGQPFAVSVVYEWSEAVPDVAFEVGISRTDGHRIVTVQSVDGPGEPVDVAPGRHEVTVVFLNVHLLPGEFMIDAACHRIDGTTIDFIQRGLRFFAQNGNPGEDRYLWPGVRGYVRPDSLWRGHDAAMPRAEAR
jgi:lipopolysaccharide transport system ATP-binding protein